MAAVPALSSYIVHGADEVRSRQKATLDVALLCSKLEAYKIQQDAVLARRENRKATSKSQNVPRSAATRFTATAASSTQGTEPQRLRHASHVREIVVSTSRYEARQHPQPSYDPLAINFDRDFELFLSPHSDTEEDREKRDSTQSSPVQQPQPAAQRPRDEQDNRRASRDYKPGDAAKRRITVAYASGDEISATLATSERPYSWTNGLNPLRWRNPGASGTQEARIAETDGHDVQERPSLAPYARANWTQESQDGDDMSHFLQFRSRSDKKVEAREQALNALEGGTLANANNAEVAARQSGLQGGHLINDAVKMMKEKERAKRKSNLLRYFKRS